MTLMFAMRSHFFVLLKLNGKCLRALNDWQVLERLAVLPCTRGAADEKCYLSSSRSSSVDETELSISSMFCALEFLRQTTADTLDLASNINATLKFPTMHSRSYYGHHLSPMERSIVARVVVGTDATATTSSGGSSSYSSRVSEGTRSNPIILFFINLFVHTDQCSLLLYYYLRTQRQNPRRKEQTSFFFPSSWSLCKQKKNFPRREDEDVSHIDYR